jgi:hypothetical protein
MHTVYTPYAHSVYAIRCVCMCVYLASSVCLRCVHAYTDDGKGTATPLNREQSEGGERGGHLSHEHSAKAFDLMDLSLAGQVFGFGCWEVRV